MLHVLCVLCQALLLSLDSIRFNFQHQIPFGALGATPIESQGETGQNTRKFSRRTEMFWSMITSNVKKHICTHLRSMEFNTFNVASCCRMIFSNMAPCRRRRLLLSSVEQSCHQSGTTLSCPQTPPVGLKCLKQKKTSTSWALCCFHNI